MRVDRLERLVKLLEADAENPNGLKFDMGTWGRPSHPQVDHLSYWEEDKLMPVNCGTTGCAMGLAALSGEFKADGLVCRFQRRYHGFALQVMMEGEDEAEGFDAAAKLFDIRSDDSCYLFSPDCYKGGAPLGKEGELFVAQRIRDFIAGKIDKRSHPVFKYQLGHSDLQLATEAERIGEV